MTRHPASCCALFLLLAACASEPGAAGAGGSGSGGTGTGGVAAGGSEATRGGQAGSTSQAGTQASSAAGAAGTAIDAGGSGGAASAGAGGTNQAGVASTWPAVTDYALAGPFPTARDKNVGPDGGYDVFRPAELGASGRRHPIISWANGTLFALDQYQPMLNHWASHGFVVVAAHTNSTAGGVTHKAGIDWLVAQNMTAQTTYFGVLDATKIGAAGHSQGGGATIAAGAGEPGPAGIVTTLPLMPIPSFEKDLTILGRQLVPMFNIVATKEDRDPAFAKRLFDACNVALVQAAFIGVHEDAMSPAMFAPTLAWFRLRLMGDETARGYFYPPQTCTLCQNSAWASVAYKP